MLYIVSMHDNTTEPDLAARLNYIWQWQVELDRAVATGNTAKAARASLWLARHKIRLAQEAGHMPVSIA